jgi:hypothetical protein
MSGKLAEVDGLSQAQEQAIVALMAEPSLARASKASGITERTLYRWLRDDRHFIKAYRRARREAFSQAIGLTQRYAPVAVSTLVKVMTDETAPHTAKVQAATTLLRFGRDGVELDDVLERVEALEAAAEVQGRRAA